MNKLLLPVSMIAICIIGLIMMLIFMRKKNRKSEEQILIAKQVVQDFMNVRDIKDIFLYSIDNFIISYVKVQAISLDLLSKSEKKILTKKLTEEFSEIDDMFKFIAVSRPVDITPLISEYADMISSTSDTIQKEILRHEIRVISEFSLSGEVVQREFYYMIWEKEKENAEVDLRKRVNDMAEKLDSSGLKCEILKKHEIIRLCNLVNNPAFAAIEDTDFEAVIPYLD